MNVASLFVAEALACYDAVKLGLNLGLSRVIIEGDVLTIVKKMHQFFTGQIRNRGDYTEY